VTGGTLTEYSDTLEVAVAENFDLGEGPIWDARSDTLLFVDCSRGHVHRLTPDDGSIATLEIGQVIGAALPCSDGGLVVTSDDGVLFCDKAGVTRLLVPIEADLTANRMNDGKCDSRGRLWSGTFSTLFHRGAGSLYRIDPDLSLTRAVSNVRVSNGIGWNGDETRMYFVDTLSGGIDVFDYDIDTGAVSNRSQFVTIAREEGLPDGLAVDAEGCIWVALFYGGEVRRYSPRGRLIGKLTLPVARVTSCNFGGQDLRDLFITTASFKLHVDGHPHEPEAGYVFRCSPGVTGLPSQPFGYLPQQNLTRE